jgi:hypothetical protein
MVTYTRAYLRQSNDMDIDGNGLSDDTKFIEVEEHKEMIKKIFDRFDEYACIKNDKWYLELKEEMLK